MLKIFHSIIFYLEKKNNNNVHNYYFNKRKRKQKQNNATYIFTVHHIFDPQSLAAFFIEFVSFPKVQLSFDVTFSISEMFKNSLDA